MTYLNQKVNFNLKAVAGLITVCVLISVFVPITNLKALSPSLSISKSVDKRFALPGDEIVYTLNYQNNGSGTATGVVIKDPFTNRNQHYLTFISATPSPNSNNDTWTIGSLDYGQSGQIIIRAKISSSIYLGSLEIRNRASIDSNETYPKYSNYASTFVSVRPSIRIDKSVKNISKNSGFHQLVSADPGDKLEFSLEIRSVANGRADNVKVWDVLPETLTYISGSTKINGSSHSDGITSEGINIGSITAGQKKTINFKAQLKSESAFSPGTTVLNNYGYAEADALYTIYDSVAITIEKEGENNSSSLSVSTSTDLTITKSARNITKKSSYWTNTIYAEPGDEIEFLIKIKSPRNKEIDSVRVSDKLPPKLSYISGSTTVDGYYEPDGITSKNIYIGEVYPYLARQIKFKAKVASASKFSLYPIDLVNIAYAWGSDGKKVDDSVKIIVREPTTPTVKGVTISSTKPLFILKSGRNISQNKTLWVDSFSANPEEEVEFSIQVSNTSDDDLFNVKVWDTLPADLLIISNSTTVNGISWGGDVSGAGLNLGTLNQGQTKTIEFRAKIGSAEKFSPGSTTLINTAYVKADNVSQISDKASVVVKTSGVVKGAATVVTGANLIGFLMAIIISCFLAFIIYCRLREDKLLEILNGKGNKVSKSLARFYFKTRFFFTAKTARFKKVYW